MIKRYLLLCCFTLLPYLLVAQYYILGDDPSGIQWKQINTDKFQIIYPSTFEIKAQRMANLLNNTYLFAGKSLNSQPSKISIVLHTSTVRSNGFVAWAPARMELFTTPHQEIYAQDWLEQLAIHEYRHVVQIDKIASEIPRIFKLLFGEQMAALVTGIYLPFWFLEGDAVVTETALSHSGRGRVPNFEMELKAQGVEKGIFSYDKAYLGSFRDYVPDYYQLGYQMVAGVRNRYGADTWAKVLHNVARKPLSFNAFSSGLKAVSGMDHPALYNAIFTDLKNGWDATDRIMERTSYELVTKDQKGYASYRYPIPMNDSTIFAVKYSMDNLTRFVQIGPKGEEKVLFTPGNLFEESITYGSGKVFWIESKTDIRWTHREFSQLRILDLNHNILTEKRYREKIYAPSLSFDGQHLAAVKVNNENRCSIVLISPKTGKIEKETLLSTDLFVLTPSWADNNEDLYAIVVGNKGKALAKLNAFTGEITILLPFSYNELAKPVQRGNWVYYTASIEGSDDLYAFNLNERSNYRITKSRFGVRDVQPSFNGKSLIYSNYTSDGYKVVKTPLQSEKFIKTESSAMHIYVTADKLAAQEKGVLDFSLRDTVIYRSKNYSKLSNIFNFHSWGPVYIDRTNEAVRPGVSLMSQNKLSTAITQLGYDYSTINKTGKWVGEFDYTGLFPVFKLHADYGQEKSDYFQINTYNNHQTHTVTKDTQQIFFKYKILNINAILNIPLNFSHGKWNRLVQPEFQIGYRQIWQEASTPIGDENSTWITYRLYAHNLLQTGIRDLQPAIGQVIDFNYHYSPLVTNSADPIWTMEGKLYFPGLLRHHGIRIYGGFQHKIATGSSLSDYISYPRGYTNLLNDQLITLRSDYILPIFYPDWSLGRISYFKRVSLRMFYDQGWVTIPIIQQNSKYKISFGSLGGELLTDCNIMRLYVPANLGIRGSYLLDRKKFGLEFLFSINFGSL